MSESTISRNPVSSFVQPQSANEKMTKEEFEKAGGMKFMSFSEMTGGNKPESGTGSASGGVDASGSFGIASVSASNSASVQF